MARTKANRKNSLRGSVIAAFLLTVMGLASRAGYAQCTLSPASSWKVASGFWNTSSNWSGGVPTSSTNACLTNGTMSTPATTTISNAGGSVLNLQIGTNNTLDVSGNELIVYGSSIENAGKITMAGGELQLQNSATLSGGGTLTLSNRAFIGDVFGGVTLTNQDNTIEGTGTLGYSGLALNNEANGIVNANSSGELLTLGDQTQNFNGAVTNAGLLEATNGGILGIYTNVTNTGTGNITAAGASSSSSTVVLDHGASITGGTLNVTGGGTMKSNSAYLSGLTISAGSTVEDTHVTYLEGTITNQGTITVPNTVLAVANVDVTLQGGGTVQMSSGAYFYQVGSGLTLNNVNNTIEGTGTLGYNGLALNNEASGIVNANINGGTLSLNGGGTITNAGLLEASNGGTLQIQNNVTNTGANITADTGSTVLINNSATITGGTLNTIGTGVDER